MNESGHAVDSFRTPGGECYSIYRAVVFDSWLLWKHALPQASVTWPQLDDLRMRGICALAQGLHQAHQSMPGYKGLLDSPFRIGRWWDPRDPDWEHGRRCLFSIDGFSSNDIVNRLAPGELRSIERGYDWVEALLPRSRLPQPDGIGFDSPPLSRPIA